ncbi:hypothetical protein PSTG_13847 [Puccinia striiformis f. sp. tritici PST-78]|uniref:CCHC-type domain-containing protein n=1 Tax=Puccinia striiformis f. sp. tritici PST-78 TaxID=1165861 RepID=A0A0L0V0I7_9BASI|nr:hypothetical protein PSTG_13847 [Puccinia striiformis f. sp. tritici PST-78]
MSSSHPTGSTSGNRPSSPIDYTLSNITGIIDTRPGAERVAENFNNHLGEGWEERLGVHRSTRQRAYSEADSTVTSFRIPGSFIPPRPSTPFPCRQPFPLFTPPSQSTSRNPTQPNQSTPFRFHSPPRPNPSLSRNQQPLPTDLSFILSPSFSFRPPNLPPPPPPPPPPPGYRHPPPSSTSPILSPTPSPTPDDTMQNRDLPPHNNRTDLEQARAQLEEAKIVGQAIVAGSATFKDTGRLEPDGSNFEQWTNNIANVGNIHLNDPDFFTTANNNRVLEKIGRGIFLASIDESLRSDVQTEKTCFAMHALVKKKFKTISRAAQMNSWRKFRTFSLDDHPSSAGIASKLRNLATEWKSLKLTFNEDTILGFVLQESVGQNTPIANDFNQRVETLVQQDPNNETPTFDKLVHLLEICRQQQHLMANASSSSPTPTVFTQQPSSVLQSSVQDPDSLPPFDQDAYLQGIHQEDWNEALHFYHVTANRCWHCSSPSHYLRDCPTRTRGTPVTRRARGPGSYSFRQQPRQTSYNPAPFYPIVGAMYPPPGLPFPPQQQFHSYQQPSTYQSPYQQYAPLSSSNYRNPALRPADYFKPDYSTPPPAQQHRSQTSTSRSTQSGGASARNVVVDGLGEDLSSVDFRSMTTSFDDVSTPAIIDSRASHHLTGEFHMLHNYRELNVRVPLNVATKGSGASISGTGELRFRAPGGTTISLKEVLYCEQARSTLISLAALRKANSFFHYNCSKDSFEIYDRLR